MDNLVPYETILAAKKGDSVAMSLVLKHYAPYIAAHSKQTYYDEEGNAISVVDDQIRQSIESELMFQIIFNFNPNKTPQGEVLEIV